jgi:hypothetical protein
MVISLLRKPPNRSKLKPKERRAKRAKKKLE